MAVWKSIPGETPIDDASGLLLKSVRTRTQLNEAEADNIRKAILRYLAARPTRRQAPFTLNWCYKLHKQMFGRGIHLKQSADKVTGWPEETVGNASIIRDEYLAALKSADAGEFAPIIHLHRRFTKT